VNPSSTAKTILFWLSIVLLGVMLWKLVSANGQAAREDEPSYSEFMAHVDSGDVKEVTMYLSPNSYELQGEYAKQKNQKFHVTVFKEAAPDLAKTLREKQVMIKVKEVRSGDWLIIFAECAAIAAIGRVLLVPDAPDASRREQGFEFWQIAGPAAFGAAEESHF
jgi:ATP-dependent Zn protease